MAGSVNGTAAIISCDYPLALYLHCASHCLNLAIVKPLQITSIRSMINIIGHAAFMHGRELSTLVVILFVCHNGKTLSGHQT